MQSCHSYNNGRNECCECCILIMRHIWMWSYTQSLKSTTTTFFQVPWPCGLHWTDMYIHICIYQTVQRACPRISEKGFECCAYWKNIHNMWELVCMRESVILPGMRIKGLLLTFKSQEKVLYSLFLISTKNSWQVVILILVNISDSDHRESIQLIRLQLEQTSFLEYITLKLQL